MTTGLLPQATIDCFWSQNYTSELFTALQTDWRFAHVTIQPRKGDIDDAIAHYRDTPSPSLLIIETDKADDVFLSSLGALASVCTDQTAALFIGPDKDTDFVRQLKNVGVADYLTRPVSVDAACKTIARILTGRLGHGQSTLTAVLGSKGGVGATRLAQALAHSCAQFLQEKTLLIDPAMTNSPLVTAYGMTMPLTAAALQPMLGAANIDTVFAGVHTVTPELKVLALRHDLADSVASLQANDIDHLLTLLQQREANIVADLSQSDAAIRQAVLQRADHVVIVTTAEPQAVRNTQQLLNDIQAQDPDRTVYLVINKTQLLHNAEATEQDLTQTLGMEPFVLIPFAAEIFTAIEMAAPAEMLKAVQPLAEFLAPLAAHIVGKPARPLKTSFAMGGMGAMLKLLGGK